MGNLYVAIFYCAEICGAFPRYQVDFMRLRTELHVIACEPGEAKAIY